MILVRVLRLNFVLAPVQRYWNVAEECILADIADFVAHTHIYYTGSQRDAREVLADQNQAMQKKESVDHARVADSLHRIKDLGHRILEAIEASNFDRWGQLLDDHWQNKKKLSSKISWSRVDEVYDEVRRRFGVLGGKVIGAGGGGFLMLYSPKQHAALESFMRDAGIIGGNFSLGPTIGEQADNELNRKTCAADNRFPKQYIRVDRKAWMSGDIGHRALRVAEEY